MHLNYMLIFLRLLFDSYFIIIIKQHPFHAVDLINSDERPQTTGSFKYKYNNATLAPTGTEQYSLG